MSLQRRNKISPTFNLSSMTDIVFLLLIFFMITSTVISPNAIKVNLPQSKRQATTHTAARVFIDADRQIYASIDGTKPKHVSLEQLPAVLKTSSNDSTDLYISLLADETVPYHDVIEVLNVANENGFKMVLATRPPKKSDE